MLMRGLLQRGIFAAVAITGAVVVTIVPAAAQSYAPPENITHVRTPGVKYDKTGPTEWVERKQNGETANFVQDRHDDTSVFLSRAFPGGGGVKLQLNVRAMRYEGSVLSSPRNNRVIGSSFFGTITEAWGNCTPQMVSFAKCTCDLPSLRPLQSAVGLGEVAKKKKDIADPKSVENEKEALDVDPIKIVIGPGGAFFVADHHHGARAWLDAGYTAGTCKLLSEPVPTDELAFWNALIERELVRLADQNGNPIERQNLPNVLPKTLKELPDDPYRTLAWMVRKADGFCRAFMNPPPPFAEFRWADWMRDKLDRDQVAAATAPTQWDKKKKQREASQADVLNAALALAKSPEAGKPSPPGADLPGWHADDEACPVDPPGGGE
jgi:hypothetical protein